jgi:hypothetical protein
MTITDAQVEAALAAWIAASDSRVEDAMRVALEAAAQAAPCWHRFEPHVIDGRVTGRCEKCGMIVGNSPAAAQAAPPPTAAPGDYERLAKQLNGVVCEGPGFYIPPNVESMMHEAAAAIRKLTAENALLRDRRKRLEAINASPLYGSGETTP